jgi:predicted NUDIX family phosphoesterase
MNVSPEEAIRRETSQRISSKPGSIMNANVLATLSSSVNETILRYGNKFPAILEHDTSTGNAKASNVQLASRIMDRLADFLDPLILVLPKAELERLPRTHGGCFTEEARNQLAKSIATFGKAMKRSEAEADAKHVQMIGCGVLVHDKRVFLFERKERDPKYRLYGRATIWQGTHVPCRNCSPDLGIIRIALVERITRSLFLSREFQVDPIGYCWDADDPKSNSHFGIMFRVDIDNEYMATDLQKKEFRKGRGHGLAGNFVDWKSLSSNDEVQERLESWSLAVLKNYSNFQA